MKIYQVYYYPYVKNNDTKTKMKNENKIQNNQIHDLFNRAIVARDVILATIYPITTIGTIDIIRMGKLVGIAIAATTGALHC